MQTHTAPQPDAAASSRLYRAVWRWHFYAGLYVIPFLLMLAVTGFFMMLFTTYLPEHGDRLPVAIALFAVIDFFLPKRQKQAGVP